MNRVVLVGRLTRNPDLRYTPNGVAVANFTIAVNRPFKNQQGENEADFINCVIWRKQAENLENYTKKLLNHRNRVLRFCIYSFIISSYKKLNIVVGISRNICSFAFLCMSFFISKP